MRWLWLTVAFVMSALAVIALVTATRDLLPERPAPVRPIELVPVTSTDPVDG